MTRAILAAVAGIIFGLGLAMSQMMNPAKVLGFFDLFGAWDPTLAFVMAGALAVAVPGFWRIGVMSKPVIGDKFHTPTHTTIDARLVIGSALFGAGWGIIGLCPGPAFAGLALLRPESWIYMAAMIAGMVLAARIIRSRH